MGREMEKRGHSELFLSATIAVSSSDAADIKRVGSASSADSKCSASGSLKRIASTADVSITISAALRRHRTQESLPCSGCRESAAWRNAREWLGVRRGALASVVFPAPAPVVRGALGGPPLQGFPLWLPPVLGRDGRPLDVR